MVNVSRARRDALDWFIRHGAMQATLDTYHNRPWKSLKGRAEAAAAVLEKQWLLCTLVFVEVYLAITILHSLRRFWYDELFTYYVTQLPSMSAVWSALKEGADFNPPLFYVVTRAFQRLFGNSELATRLPAILGFLVMLLCVFHFVSRYGSRLAGLTAMSFPLITGAYYYAAEARAYGMMLGFVGLAAVCWQSSARNEQRNILLPGLAAALAGALMSHCYAVLALIPFALAEAARAIVRRKFDWPMLAALAAPCPLVLVYLPLLGASRVDSFDNPFFRAEWASIPDCYVKLFGDALVPLLVASVFLALARDRGRSSLPPQNATAPIPAHEIALALGFSLVPIFAVLLAMTVTRLFEFRYALAATVGVSILLGALVARRTRRCHAAAAAVLLLFVGTFAVTSAAWLVDLSGAPKLSREASQSPLRLSDLSDGVPIVMADPILFLEFDHYESSGLIDRMYFLTDRAAALRYTGATGFGSLDRLKKWFPIRARMEDYREFVSSHSRFFVVTSDRNPLCWVMRKVADDGIPFVSRGEFSSQHGHAVLSEVLVTPEK
jgi:hypothetical protein